jgi:hypothetical protein
MATVVGEEFEKWVKDTVNDRNRKRTVKANKLIEVDQDIYAAFMDSTAVSCKYDDIFYLKPFALNFSFSLQYLKAPVSIC